MRDFWTFGSAGQIVFGRGVSRRVASIAGRFHPKRVLVLSDRILQKAGIVSPIVTAIRESGVEVAEFLDCEPEPATTIADAAIHAARQVNPDVIVAIGGGSNMDVAKIVTAVLTHGGTYSDYFGHEKIPGPLKPLICLPTTSGTGSEVSHAAVLTDTANHIKVSTLSQYLRPAVAIVDPLLTVNCPAKVTADSGIDALTHAVEAFTATRFDELEVGPDEPFPYCGKQPLGDCLAERAIELVGRHLETAVREPRNLDAREGMSLAALLAGLAFSNNAVAAVHGLEYPVGGLVHVSHGAGNGLFLPAVMKFNLPARVPELIRIAELLGEDLVGLDGNSAANRAIIAVERIRRAIGIPEHLSDLGVKREQLPELARKTHAITRLMLLTPRRPSEADLLKILEECF